MEKQKRTKIISIFMILIIALHIQHGYCQSISKVIKVTIIDQKQRYHKSDTLQLKFENLTKKKLWVIVGFEVFEEGKWEEVFYDLDRPLTGIEKIYSLDGELKVHLLVKNVPFIGRKSPPYRLFIKYSNNNRLLKPRKEELVKFTFFK